MPEWLLISSISCQTGLELRTIGLEGHKITYVQRPCPLCMYLPASIWSIFLSETKTATTNITCIFRNFSIDVWKKWSENIDLICSNMLSHIIRLGAGSLRSELLDVYWDIRRYKSNISNSSLLTCSGALLSFMKLFIFLMILRLYKQIKTLRGRDDD